MKREASQFSIVLQGAVGPLTGEAVASIRRHLPGVTIILSTWEHTNVEGLDVDQVVFSTDPGGLPAIQKNKPGSNNINRQIISTREGLKRVTTPYAIKMRTDTRLAHAAFVSLLQPGRLLVPQFFTLDPTMLGQVTYHFSDWFQVGETPILQQYWDVPLMTAEDATWYDTHAYAPHSTTWDKSFRCRLPVEQFLATHYAARHGYHVPRYHNDISPAILRDHWRFMAEKTIVANLDQIGLVFPKYIHLPSSPLHRYNCISHRDWQYRSGVRTWRVCAQHALKKAASAALRMVDRLHIASYAKALYTQVIGPTYVADAAHIYTPVLGQAIAPQDVSIIIQGPLHRHREGQGIEACLASIRQHASGAEIIIATWPDQDVSGLQADSIVALPDPGGVPDVAGRSINTARQAYSTAAGLKKATRPWVLKMRADAQLCGTELFYSAHFGEAVPSANRLLQQPIVTLDFIARDPAKVPYLFHPSDLIQFGRREDMLDFWEGEVFAAEQVRRASPYSCNPVANWVGATQSRQFPEQSLMLRWIKKHGLAFDLNQPADITFAAAQCSEQLLLSHFAMVAVEASGVQLPSRLLKASFARRTIYKPEEAPAIAAQAFTDYRARYRRIWLNKYVFFFTSRYWFWTMVSLALSYLPLPVQTSIRRFYKTLAA